MMLDTKQRVSYIRGMSKLSLNERVQILSMLVVGSSMRSVSRVADVSINTVAKLLAEAGEACIDYHDEHVRGLNCERIECDEIWSFIFAKEKNVTEDAPPFAGDVWTWTALCANTKLICNWFIGGRDADYAKLFMDDLASRLNNRVQMTTDGHKAYLKAIEGALGAEIDYAQLVKLFGAAPEGAKGRYSPAQCTGIKKTAKIGSPKEKHVSTSYAERQNLTMRMHMRRLTRLTNAFSKKFESHCHMMALYFVWYNFIRNHTTLKTTPAVAAGLADQPYGFDFIVGLVEARAPKTGRPKKNT
jgi:IS1 family transposase